MIQRGFMVVEAQTDGYTYACDVAQKVWLDRAKAEAHAKTLNLGAYRERWIIEEQEERMKVAEERLPRVSPKDRLQVRMAALLACRDELPVAFEALGLTEPPERFVGPFEIRDIEVE